MDYQSDVRISDELIRKVSDTYRKIRNTFKFMLANLNDGDRSFDIEKDSVEVSSRLGNYLLCSLEKTKNGALNAYARYDFANAVSILMNFLTGDCSALYFSIAKDPLYCNAADDPVRREFQTVIYRILDTLSKLFAPILCFTMDEVYRSIEGNRDKHIALSDMPKATNEYDESFAEEFDRFKKVRGEAMKALEDARNRGIIGSSQEAAIEIALDDDRTAALFGSFDEAELNRIFIVSRVKIAENTEKELRVSVSRHEGQKCERCWNYFDELLEADGNRICPRCKR